MKENCATYAGNTGRLTKVVKESNNRTITLKKLC